MPDDQKHSAPLSRGRRAGGEDEKGKQSPKLPLHAGAEPHQFKYARQLRRDMTKAEKVLWEHLRARRFMDLKFRRQHPILEFIADFYCHKLKLIVEVDGKYHEEDDATYYDSERTKEMKRYGYSVVRFSNERILKNIDEVLVELKEFVARLKGTSPQPLSFFEERGFRAKSKSSTKNVKTSRKTTPSPRGEGRGEVENRGDKA